MATGKVQTESEKVYTKALCEGLRRLWTSGDHSDVTVEVGEKTFKCHKSILASLSLYFDAMFNSGMRESISGHVTFPEMDPDLFEIVLRFIYTGDAESGMTTDNAVELLRIAALLQISTLQGIIEEFLHPHLTNENCLKVWRLSMLHDCRTLTDKAVELIARNFKDIIQTDDFWELDGREVAAIIKEDALDVESEDQLCDIVIRWIEKDIDKRKECCGMLFENIRLAFLSPEALINLEEKHEFLRENFDCMKIINNAKSFKLLPARQQEAQGKQTCLRLSSNQEEVLVLLGGCESTTPPYVRSLSVICYSFYRKEWFSLASLPYDPGIEFASCTYQNDIYINGGGSMQKCLLWYDCDKNKWDQTMTCMQYGRRRHAIVAVTGALYAIGGYDNKLEEGQRMLSNVEKYIIREDRWEEAGDLPVAVSSFSAAVIGETIYIFGGEKNDRKDTAFIQCYETRTQQATKVDTRIPMACKLTKSVTCDRRIFLIFFDGRVVEFVKDRREPNKKPYCRTVGRLTAFQRIHFGVIQHRGNVIVLGGEIDNSTLCSDLIMFDPSTTGCTKLKDTLPKPRLIDGCVKIAVQKKYLNTPSKTE
ncbi:hypothetical protein FSP39_018672 [Pinctada imbricata]|uniref:BTB domain-containing protein n=1 Tax=Pinctada imbricata TaxID=66713 RepID=A0AA89BYZ6_PINIB|nr:hypothetical protein FSP39_018672 [Pinctada imbricata]